MTRNAAKTQWRAGFSRRGTLAPPSARPTKLLGLRNQPSLHRIPFNITLNTLELLAGPHHPIKVLLLPKLLAAPSQDPVGQKSGWTLGPPNNLRNRHNRRTKQVDVVGHDNEGMQCTETVSIGLKQLFLNQTSDLLLPQIKRTSLSRIEQPVPSHKSSTRTQVLPLEDTLRGQASPQPPSEKGGHPRSIDMRQTSPIGSHLLSCRNAAVILKQPSGAEAPRRLKPALQSQ